MTDTHKLPPKRFFTWDIHYACNYRCTYCYFHDSWEEQKQKNRYPGLARWKEIWDGIYKKYGGGHIHVSGGEPFNYPDFVELVIHLAKNFTVEFDTNLTFDVKKFIANVKPDRVKFATAFHPQFIAIDDYIEKAVALKKAGFDLGVNYVAYPEQLADMAAYKKRFDEVHISFDVMPFRGRYRDKEYPQSYTAEEKKLICETDPRTAPKMLSTYGNDAPKKEEKPHNPHRGKLCRMGQFYTKIHPNGNAYRCCLAKEPDLLGNLIDGTFSFYEEPKPCSNDKCPCWVAMIPGEEDNWLFHWVEPKVKMK